MRHGAALFIGTLEQLRNYAPEIADQLQKKKILKRGRWVYRLTDKGNVYKTEAMGAMYV